jgi:hypothetical protein
MNISSNFSDEDDLEDEAPSVFALVGLAAPWAAL